MCIAILFLIEDDGKKPGPKNLRYAELREQDLTFCHLHMTNRDMLIFETFENPATYLSGELSDEGALISVSCGGILFAVRR